MTNQSEGHDLVSISHSMVVLDGRLHGSVAVVVGGALTDLRAVVHPYIVGAGPG